jgi:hypothetical protein
LVKKRIIFVVKVFFILAVLHLSNQANAQTGKNTFIEWSTWLLTQSAPSPVYFQDKNEINSAIRFGFRWQITPINYSFNTNKLVSPVSFLKVNPLRRHSGSVELLIEPQWTTGNFYYSDLNRFSLGTGLRCYLPLKEYGEYLSTSLAVKYNLQNNKNGSAANCYGVEAGIYTLFGIIGLKYNYNFNSASTFNIGLNIKYY